MHTAGDAQYSLHQDTFHQVVKLWVYLANLTAADGALQLLAPAVVANERYVAAWARRYGCSACDPYNLVVRRLGELRARYMARGTDT